jgi:phenylpyruvate tautomerase PptA (4-oxalocrotonate tautomerase family)
VWTSGQAKQTGAVDPRVQILVDELKIQSWYDQGQSSIVPRRTVTSQMLLSKY